MRISSPLGTSKNCKPEILADIFVIFSNLIFLSRLRELGASAEHGGDPNVELIDLKNTTFQHICTQRDFFEIKDTSKGW